MKFSRRLLGSRDGGSDERVLKRDDIQFDVLVHKYSVEQLLKKRSVVEDIFTISHQIQHNEIISNRRYISPPRGVSSVGLWLSSGVHDWH